MQVLRRELSAAEQKKSVAAQKLQDFENLSICCCCRSNLLFQYGGALHWKKTAEHIKSNVLRLFSVSKIAFAKNVAENKKNMFLEKNAEIYLWQKGCPLTALPASIYSETEARGIYKR